MQITQSYLGVTRGHVRCLFFLLYEDYLDAQAGLSERMQMEIERFARNMGEFGAVVAPFLGDTEKTWQEVLDKPWAEGPHDQTPQTPALLMIDQDFAEFDPREHRYVIFHLDKTDGEAGLFRSLLQKLVDALHDHASDPFDLVSEALREDEIAQATELFELKPGIYGVSIDLKRGWKALKKFLRERRSTGDSI